MSHAFVQSYESITRCLTIPIVVYHKDKRCAVTALWDTGATSSVVSLNVIAQLGLQANGVTRISNTSSVDKGSYRYTYTASMLLPGHIAFENLRVIGSTIGDKDVDVIIGMDIITFGDFSVSNYQGKTTLTFRAPSQGVVDYTECKTE